MLYVILGQNPCPSLGGLLAALGLPHFTVGYHGTKAFEATQTWVQVSVLPPTCCVASDK